MAETAAHLVDHVLPHLPVRQWVLSVSVGRIDRSNLQGFPVGVSDLWSVDAPDRLHYRRGVDQEENGAHRRGL